MHGGDPERRFTACGCAFSEVQRPLRLAAEGAAVAKSRASWPLEPPACLARPRSAITGAADICQPPGAAADASCPAALSLRG